MSQYKTLSNSINDVIQRAFSLTREQQCFEWYTGKISKGWQWWVTSYRQDDEVLIYSETLFVLKMGKSLYAKASKKKGFTLNKKTRKMKLWPGTTIKDLDLESILKELGKEWVTNEGFISKQIGFVSILTGTLLRDILLDRITNPTDLCKKVISSNGFKGLSPEKLRKHIKDNAGRSAASHAKVRLMMCKDAVVDINDVLTTDFTSIIDDTLEQAKALGEKIDLTWSKSRMNEVHTEFSKRIMAVEINSLEDELVNYPPLNIPEGYNLLTTKKEIFAEGMTMGHCLYTNYWDRIKGLRYICLHTDKFGDPLTIGIRHAYDYVRKDNAWELDQIQGVRNSSPKQEIHKQILNEMQDFLKSLPEKKDLLFSRSCIDQDDFVLHAPYQMPAVRQVNPVNMIGDNYPF